MTDECYRVIYLVRAKREWLPGTFTLERAAAHVRYLKRRGLTVWVVNERGAFVPIPGVKREPGWSP